MKDNLLIFVSLSLVVSNLYLLGTSRIRAMIRGVAAQGFLIAAFPLLLSRPAESTHTVILVIIGIVVKGIAIPYLLVRAVRGVMNIREITPTVGYSLSVIYGILTAGFSFWALKSLPLASATISPMHASIAIATAFAGIFLIVARLNVVAQVIGYLVFENAAYILGVSVAARQPLLVEMGVLMDLLVGVFIMVVVINRIHTEHDTISSTALERLAR